MTGLLARIYDLFDCTPDLDEDNAGLRKDVEQEIARHRETKKELSSKIESGYVLGDATRPYSRRDDGKRL